MPTSILEKSVRACSIVLLLALFIIFLTYGFSYLYPFLIVFVLARLLHPIVTLFEQKSPMPRQLATLLVMGVFFSGTGLFSYFLFKKLIQESVQFLDTFPLKFDEIKGMLIAYIQQVYAQLSQLLPFIAKQDIEAYLSEWLDQLNLFSMEVVKSILLTSTNIIHSVSYFGLISLFIMLAVYLVTNDFVLFQTEAKKRIPGRLLQISSSFTEQFGRSFSGLLRAQIILAFISASLVLIGMFFFKMEHVLLITLLVFLLDLIPYLGIGILFIPWIVFSYLTHDYTATIQLSALYTCLILLRNVLEPKLIAQSMGIHPFIALSVLFLGVQLFGITGIFLTPLFLICISALYRAGILRIMYQFIHTK